MRTTESLSRSVPISRLVADGPDRPSLGQSNANPAFRCASWGDPARTQGRCTPGATRSLNVSAGRTRRVMRPTLNSKHREHPNDRYARRRCGGPRKRESRSRGASFRDTLNDLLRAALPGADNKPRRRTLRIKPSHMGQKPGLNYDNVEALLEYGEGEQHR